MLTSPNTSSCFAWNSVIWPQFATTFFKHSDIKTSAPQQRSSSSVGGQSSLGSSKLNNRSAKCDSPQTGPKTCRQWNYLGSCTCHSSSATYAGHHKCRVCAENHPMLHCPNRRLLIPDVTFSSTGSWLAATHENADVLANSSTQALSPDFALSDTQGTHDERSCFSPSTVIAVMQHMIASQLDFP